MRETFSAASSRGRVPIAGGEPLMHPQIDEIVAGVRSACTYTGAADLAAFHARAVIGVQSQAGYAEGRPLMTSW